MLRSLALILFMFTAGPAFAGCWNADNPPDNEAPVLGEERSLVAICYQRGCSEGFQTYFCGTAETAYYGYSNGWRFVLSDAESYAISPEGEGIDDLALVRCYEDEDYLCPTLRGE